MRKTTMTVASVLLAGAVSFPVMAADSRIVHEPIACVPAGGNARLVAEVQAPDAPTSMRVYFRASSGVDDYYVEMRRGDGGRYWALLPVPSANDAAVLYRIQAKDTDGKAFKTDTRRVLVSMACPAPQLSGDEKKYGRNLIVGLTTAQQTEVPVGFSCAGIVGRISASGELKSVPGCGAGVMLAGGSTGQGNVGTATGTTGVVSRPATAASQSADGLVIGGTQGTSVTSGTIQGNPISSARPTKPKN